MKKIAIVSIFATAILVITLLVKLNSSKPVVQNDVSVLETKENSEGLVIVAVAPKNLSEFKITLNTHSEELDMDLVKIAELLDDQGRVYKPISWEGAPAGGHHREGILKFKPILPKPKSIELKIKNVGGVAERNFEWIF